MSIDLIHIEEPKLLFGHGQSVEDPHDGLALFGPLDSCKPEGIRVGVIGRRAGVGLLKDWLSGVQGCLSINPPHPARPPYPGFEAIFHTRLSQKPMIEITIPDGELDTVRLDDVHQRVYKTVDVYSSRIIRAITEDEKTVDVWYVVVPDDVWRYCRPKSTVAAELRIKTRDRMSRKSARSYRNTGSLWEEYSQQAVPYHYQPNFHNQLKARLLEYRQPIQIVKEGTLEPYDPQAGTSWRIPVDFTSEKAWYLSTATFYKAGGRPWKLAQIRDGVCYIGIVFKRDDSGDGRSACCAAQMFLDSGDGFVFKGDVGPWYSPRTEEFHLTRQAARELVGTAVRTYVDTRGVAPKELFLHGRVSFADEEWKGFSDAVDGSTNLVGIRIRKSTQLKLFTDSENAVLRGTFYVQDAHSGYLWTAGLIPKLGTYPGRETPNPIRIDICQGNASIQTVARDVMALTKLNYNACRISDGLPITLKFADAVGEILTAGPINVKAPLPFKFYM